MGATQMYSKEMGWQTQWRNGAVMLKDNQGDVRKPNPAYRMGLLRSMLEEARIQVLWTQASMHRHGSGMEQGMDLTATTRENYN
eukprot:570055-Karenia_brevis.AAC.1